MFPLTHVVLGCGATWADQRLLGHLQGSASVTETPRHQAVDPTDYRLVAVGAMLPDVVDKPLGIYLLRRQLRNGRVYGHTLLLSPGLVVAAYEALEPSPPQPRAGRSGIPAQVTN